MSFTVSKRQLLSVGLLALSIPCHAQDVEEPTESLTETLGETPSDAPLSAEDVRAAASLIGLTFTASEIELMLPDLRERIDAIEELRAEPIPNGLPPALVFSPRVPGMLPPRGSQLESTRPTPRATDLDLDEEAFFFQSIPQISAKIRSGHVSCVELAEAYIARLERLDPHLHCVIHITRDRALAQARVLDAEIAEGKWRGVLHGIPWGVKDLMSVPGTPTTWGAKPFEGQVLDETAAVVERLDAAGAVLIAKLSVGALAWGDVWYGGKTRSPWNLDAGSSGSSAGSASATAAGGVVFALGTETLGSIVSPSVVCGTCALRPTFGRVSRRGTMALCWSMDKVGPITRHVEDARIVFKAIQGRDPLDPSSRNGDVPSLVSEFFTTEDVTANGVVGVLAGSRKVSKIVDEAARELEALGHEIVEVTLPSAPLDGILLTLGVEAAAAFDELTRSGRDDELVRQVRNAWPNVFRAARTVPAVAYVQAQRLRTKLMLDMDLAFVNEAAKDGDHARVDAILHTPYAGGILSITNLTGHPTVVLPFVPKSGPRRDGSPATICLTGPIDHDESLLEIGACWQAAHPEHRLHPDVSFDDAEETEASGVGRDR